MKIIIELGSLGLIACFFITTTWEGMLGSDKMRKFAMLKLLIVILICIVWGVLSN